MTSGWYLWSDTGHEPTWRSPKSRTNNPGINQKTSTSMVNPHSWQTCRPMPSPRFSITPKTCLCSWSFRLCHTPSLVRLRKSRSPSSNFLFFFFFFSSVRRSHSVSRASGEPHFFHAKSSTWHRKKSIMFANVDLWGLALSRWGSSSRSRSSAGPISICTTTKSATYGPLKGNPDHLLERTEGRRSEDLLLCIQSSLINRISLGIHPCIYYIPSIQISSCTYNRCR